MKLLKEIRACKACKGKLPFPPKPVVQFSTKSKILIVGQAPGTKVHETGIAWNDPSGDRLREWLSVSKQEFYDTGIFGIAPMGFCYPGKGKSGDLPPRPECAPLWMGQILEKLKKVELILLIGQYSQKYFLAESVEQNLTKTVKSWKSYQPKYFVLPHPSPRNNIWLRKNPWFEKEVVPALQKKVRKLLQ